MTYFTGIVDFGATDAPMTDAQLASSTKGPILHIPVTIGAVAISYNLAGVSGHLNLTGPIIANIYLGTVKYWDDASITAINSGVSIPHQTIAVVHRSDGSGTTGIFTHYLSAISPDWMSKVGAGTTVNWPTGVGAKGNSGVAAQVKSTTGAIGYNELGYVLTNSIQYAAVQNANMKYVVPSVDSAAAAAQNINASIHSCRSALLLCQRAWRCHLPHHRFQLGNRLPEPDEYGQRNGHCEHALVGYP